MRSEGNARPSAAVGVERKARRVSAMFARISGRYDFMNTVMTAGMHGRWRCIAARLACQGMRPGQALDVGTGTGKFAFELGRRPEVKGIVGVDFVPQMLAIARAGEERLRSEGAFHWSLGDAMELPFRDNVFGCAVTGFTMRNVDDLGRAISEMVRVVRPEGRVVILEITPQDSPGVRSRLLGWYFRRVVPLLGGLLAGDRAAYTYLPESVESFPTPLALARMMEEAGLTGVTWRSLGVGLVSLHVGEVPEKPGGRGKTP